MFTPKKLTLRKSERLKSKKAIERLFKEGRSFFVYPFKVVYLIQQPAETTHLLQTGFSVATRNFKRAHDRNRIKRITKEAYRIQKSPLALQVTQASIKLDLFFIYTAKQIEPYHLVSAKIDVILRKLHAEVHAIDGNENAGIQRS